MTNFVKNAWYVAGWSTEIDDALRRSLDPLRALRFRRITELAYHLRPAPKGDEEGRRPWREPANVWQAIATVLLLLLILSWWLK